MTTVLISVLVGTAAGLALRVIVSSIRAAVPRTKEIYDEYHESTRRD